MSVMLILSIMTLDFVQLSNVTHALVTMRWLLNLTFGHCFIRTTIVSTSCVFMIRLVNLSKNQLKYVFWLIHVLSAIQGCKAIKSPHLVSKFFSPIVITLSICLSLHCCIVLGYKVFNLENSYFTHREKYKDRKTLVDFGVKGQG